MFENGVFIKKYTHLYPMYSLVDLEDVPNEEYHLYKLSCENMNK